jgi:hypothetical protein
MKPGDHPDFFRLPPPPGRSRESTIVLSPDGRFFHDGAPVEHVPMQRAFATWLQRHPDDGRWILNNGYDWSYLTVEGPAFFVRSFKTSAEGPVLELLDGRSFSVSSASAALEQDPEGVVWAALPSGERARFTPGAQLELSPWLVEREGQLGLEISGKFAPIRPTSAG